MAIDKLTLFEKARDRWPHAVAEPELVAIYRAIDEACEPTGLRSPSDEWSQLAIWAFHQAISALARDTSTKIVRRDDVTFEEFDLRMRFNLRDESWSEERQEYENSPLRLH